MHLKFPLKEWREDFLCFIRQCKKKNFFPEVSYKVVEILWSSFSSKMKELKEIMEQEKDPLWVKAADHSRSSFGGDSTLLAAESKLQTKCLRFLANFSLFRGWHFLLQCLYLLQLRNERAEKIDIIYPSSFQFIKH